jgi:hypothetical protein
MTVAAMAKYPRLERRGSGDRLEFWKWVALPVLLPLFF